MTQELKNQLAALLAEGKFNEVKKLVSGLLAGDLTDEERGAVLAGIALAYMEAENAAKGGYRDALAEGVATIEKVDKAGKELENQAKIDTVRSELQ